MNTSFPDLDAIARNLIALDLAYLSLSIRGHPLKRSLDTVIQHSSAP